MPTRSEWNLGLIDSAWFGSPYEGLPGRLQTRRIGFDSIDLFVGFDPGRMTVAERQAYVDGVRSVDLPVISLVCTCLGLNDFNPAIRNYHIERAKNVVELAAGAPVLVSTTSILPFVTIILSAPRTWSSSPPRSRQ